MAFLGPMLGLVGSLFGGRSGATSSPYIPSNFDALQVQSDITKNQLLETSLNEQMKSADTQRLVTTASGQSSRSIMRAAMLSTVVKQHEGLMQSIQSAESNHIKGSFDLIKNS